MEYLYLIEFANEAEEYNLDKDSIRKGIRTMIDLEHELNKKNQSLYSNLINPV